METYGASLVIVEEVYKAMEGFIKHLAHRFCNDDIMFEYDELCGDLNEELVKGMRYYAGKISDIEQLKAVLRRCLDNRIAELRHRHYGTHRVKARLNISIDIDFDVDVIDIPYIETLCVDDANPEILVESYERVEKTRNLLSDVSRRVFDACIFGNNRLAIIAWLSALRRSAVKPHAIAYLRPWMIVESLGISEPEVKKAFTEISNAYQEVCSDSHR